MYPSQHTPRQPCDLLIALLCASLLLGMLRTDSQAQVPSSITPDGTLGTAVSQTGNLYNITGGTRPGEGPNLFHSFDRFSVGTNDTARFSSPPGTENILSRVTGGQQSLIDGRLQSRTPGANVYLLNPSGVLFGQNASLDIRGSFHVSTADFLRFADGATFSAHLSEKSTLTVAPPAAFGFLQAHPAGISMQGSRLRVPEGQAFSVVGGDVRMVGGELVARNGRVQIASVASPGEVRFSPLELAPDLQVDSFAQLGQLEITQGALLDASGNGGGTVLIRSGQLLVESAQIFADNLGPVDSRGLGVDIRVAGDARMVSGSFITTDSLGDGRAGDLRITAGGLHLDDALIGSRPLGSGTSGAVMLSVGSLTLTGGAQISSSTFGPRQGGNVTILATGAVTVAGTTPDGARPSGIFTTARGQGAGAGDAGTLVVQAGSVTVTDGAQISASTSGSGHGGSVTIIAREGVMLAGAAPNSAFPSGIFTSAEGQGADAGNAGTLLVQAGTITLTGGAQIGASTVGPGQGGNVTILATGAVTLAGTTPDGTFPSGIFTTTEGQGAGAGNAGTLLVQAGTVTVTGGAQISGSTSGPGQGGSVTIIATGRVTITGRNSGLLTSASGSGAGGNLTVQAGRLQLSDNAVISAQSLGASNAGNITIIAQEMVLSDNSRVTTEARSADGGDITVTAQEMVQLRDSQITARVGGGPQTVGGNITIDPQFVILENSQITANAFEGRGGNIQITAGVFLADPASQVSASSALGIDGQVDIRAPVSNLSGLVTPLPPGFAQAVVLLVDRCAVRLREGTVSSFVVRGRDGMPANPTGVLPSPLYPASPSIAEPTRSGQHQRETTASRQRKLRRDTKKNRQVRSLPAATVPSPALELECVLR